MIRPGLLLLLLPSAGLALPDVELDPDWPAVGATIAAPMAPAGSLRALPDGTGAVLLAWQEARRTDPASCNCRNTDDLYVQRLDSAGRKTWSRTDVEICIWRGLWGGGDTLAAFEPLADGGALIAWFHGDGPNGTFAQRIGPDGSMRWGAEGVTAYASSMGSKWTVRTARDPGGALWFGLDDDSDAAVRIGRCTAGASGLICSTPLIVPLSGKFQTLILLPGDRPGRAQVAAATRAAGGRSQLEVIPLEAGRDGRIRAAAPVPIGTIRVDFAAFVAVPDGSGGALLGWTAPSGTGFDLVVRAIGGTGRTRWTRTVGWVTGATAPVLIAPTAGGTAVAWQEQSGAPFLVTFLDRQGRPRARRILGRAARSERRAGSAGMSPGHLFAWLEWNGGERETLRVALLDPATPSSTVPVEGVAILEGESRILLERIIVVAPDRAVVLVHDGATRALKAFGVRLR